jgi:hypothetical protein
MTPFGDTPTPPGAGEVGASEPVAVADDDCDDEGVEDEGAGPDPDEHPVRSMGAATDTAAASIAAAVAAQPGYLRMKTIYATLAAVMEHIGFQECCQAS